MRKKHMYLSCDLRVLRLPGTDVTDDLVRTLEAWIAGLHEKDKEALWRLAIEAGKGGNGYTDWDNGLAALVELSMRKMEEKRQEIPETAGSRTGRPKLPKRKFKWLLACCVDKKRRHLLLDWQEMCGAETDGMAMLVWMDLMAADGLFGETAPRLPPVCTFDLDLRAEELKQELRERAASASARLG